MMTTIGANLAHRMGDVWMVSLNASRDSRDTARHA
uniref:Uncharacterized protein n=1 Tax=Arundo donax TaxID=35708 RepID=A0A0A8XND6_ARUDO